MASGKKVIIDTDEWADSVLADADPVKAAKYREQLPVLDRKLSGLDDDVKAKVLRVMINTDIKPDDAAHVIAILYGHIEAVGKTIPDEMRLASSEFRDLLDNFVNETTIFPEVVSQVQQRVAADITEQALQIGKTAVAAAAVEEVERMRIRLTSASEEVLKQFLENAIKEKAARSTDTLVVKNRSITAIATIVCVLAGFFPGMAYGSFHANLSRDEISQMRYGREFVRMYQDMPSSISSWVNSWVKEHPVK